MKTNSVHFFNDTKIKTVCSNCELILAAWELRNPSNIGHIIRLSHNINARKAIFVGDYQNYRESKIKKTAGLSFDQQEWLMMNQKQFFSEIKNESKLVILETSESSINIFESRLPEKTILLAGNETNGVPENIIQKGTLNVYIPMPGNCKSMNISHALAVAAFEWYRQHSK